MRKLLLAALVAGTAATPAFAQPAGDASPFTGFRVEGIAGFDRLSSGDRDDGQDTSDDEGDESLEGAAFGAGAGFDFDLGGVVAGVEAEYLESTAEQEFDETVDGINVTGGFEVGRDIYVGGRIGFRAGPSTLVYGKAGYTNTSIEANFDGGGDRFEFDSNVDGWRLGAGIEQLFGPRAYGKLEYRYSKYNNLDFSDDFDLDDLDSEDLQTNIDLDRHQIVAGVGIRF
nr:porin family protein [uncultured Sphingosinicella sp.]